MTTPADASSGHKPALRGAQHQWAAVVAAVAGVYLVTTAPNHLSQVAVAIYSASLVLLLTVTLVPFFAFFEVARVLGGDRMRALFTTRREEVGAPG